MYTFDPQMTSVLRSNKYETPCKPSLKVKKMTMTLIKVVLLIQNSNKKTNFRKIKLILDFENWHQESKDAVF